MSSLMQLFKDVATSDKLAKTEAGIGGTVALLTGALVLPPLAGIFGMAALAHSIIRANIADQKAAPRLNP
jgi:hypothetical protein